MKNRYIKLALNCVCVMATASGSLVSVAQESVAGTASFSLSAKTDSESTLGRHYTVVRYADEACKKIRKGSKLYREKYADDQHDFDAMELTAGEPFIFQVDYEEKRRQSERLCSASIGFIPLQGRRYKALYEVSGQVSRCEIMLFDITEGEQQIEPEIVPEIMCTRRGANGNRNGVPTHAMIDRF